MKPWNYMRLRERRKVHKRYAAKGDDCVNDRTLRRDYPYLRTRGQRRKQKWFDLLKPGEIGRWYGVRFIEED